MDDLPGELTKQSSSLHIGAHNNNHPMPILMHCLMEALTQPHGGAMAARLTVL